MTNTQEYSERTLQLRLQSCRAASKAKRSLRDDYAEDAGETYTDRRNSVLPGCPVWSWLAKREPKGTGGRTRCVREHYAVGQWLTEKKPAVSKLVSVEDILKPELNR